MLANLSQAHVAVCILPNLRGFTSSQLVQSCPAPRRGSLNNASQPHRLRHSLRASLQPSAQESGKSSAIADQLDKAVRFQDVEACIYIFRHRSRNDISLSLTKNQLHTLVSSAFHLNRPELAVDLVLALPNRDLSRDFSVLMRECLQRRDLVALQKILRARAAAGIPPDAYSASAEISALGAARQTSAAIIALQNAWDLPSCRTVEVCNAAISACAVAGDWPGAQASFNLLRVSGLEPDIVTYNALIKAAGVAGLMEKVKELFEEVLTEGLSPSPVTYTGVFSAAAKNRCTDSLWLFKLFNDMAVPPNDYILSSFFSAISCAPCSRPQLEAVFSALAEARSASPLNDTVYSSLLKLLTRQGIADRAVDVWRAAQQDGVALSPHLFSALFNACAAGQSPALVDVALDAYGDLREWWAAQDKQRMDKLMERDVLWAYNSLLNFVGAERRFDEALAVFENMKRDGPLPDTITFNTLITIAGRVGDSKAAVSLFREMTSLGAKPTDRTMGALLHAFATVGDATGAAVVLKSLEDSKSGIKLNAVMYTSFIHALVTSGKPEALESAFHMADEMRKQGLAPTAVTYGCLLNACDKLGDVQRAFSVYEQACAEGIPPSDAMHDILIGVFSRSGRLDEALDLVKAMARRHAPMQQHTLDSLVRALSFSSPWRALRMLSLMQARGMAASAPTYAALVTSCARASEGVEAIMLYRAMREQGMEVDGSTGSALIVCLCQSQDVDHAVVVYEDMMLAAWRRETTPSRKSSELRKSGLPKRAQVPDAAAVASLAHVFAARGEMSSAWRFYKQLRRVPIGVEEVLVSHRRMFESLIEQNCRARSVERALIVFDDWKAASAAWLARREESSAASAAVAVVPLPSLPEDDGDVTATTPPSSIIAAPITMTVTLSSPSSAIKTRKLPKLSNVTLAFLEACCRTQPHVMWRIYDVCAIMRVQNERKLQQSLARPQKASHHVLGPVQLDEQQDE